MRRQIVVLFAALAMVLSTTAVAGAGVVKNTSGVYTLPGFAAVDGASIDAVIAGGGANISASTSGLVSGNAYTLWSISFSHPEFCQFGDPGRGTLCGFGDDGPGPQGFAVKQVGGNIAGGSGNVTISGRVTVENPAGAEYHVIVADHGPMDPADMPNQIKSPGPGVQIGFLIP